MQLWTCSRFGCRTFTQWVAEYCLKSWLSFTQGLGAAQDASTARAPCKPTSEQLLMRKWRLQKLWPDGGIGERFLNTDLALEAESQSTRNSEFEAAQAEAQDAFGMAQGLGCSQCYQQKAAPGKCPNILS